ncbi:MAG: DNA (cytosine-5-)-methyltransferase [Gemmatimonadales bacterium]|nr:DNA (cytosine-5-)-methyltransferase [Gemmatimonadales bacterium]
MSLQTHPETPPGGHARLLRESLDLTQAEAAVILGFSARQVARWESGEAAVRPAVIKALQALQTERIPSGGDFTFIDLFAGVGGFRAGFEGVGGRCVFTSEWDRWAQKTYKANFGDHEVHGDIRAVDETAVPDHDVLLAGFPCQPFSIAGVSKKNALGRKHGFECETQGTLFFDIERIIAAKRPKAFVLENVKNLVSHDRGLTFAVIIRTLREKLGYEVSWRVLDARSWVPQHRERIFIVGIRPDLAAKFDFNDVDVPDAGPTLGTILHPTDGSGPAEEPYTGPDGRPAGKYVLSDHLWGYLQEYASRHKARGNGFGFGLVRPGDVTRTLSARYYKDGSEILIHRGRGNPRRLTPRECARLMGFDRPGREPFRIVVSDTQAYKQFGNAVAVPVVAAVAKALAPYLRGERTGTVVDQEMLTTGLP